MLLRDLELKLLQHNVIMLPFRFLWCTCVTSVTLTAESRSNIMSVIFWIQTYPLARGDTYNISPGISREGRIK